MADSKNSTKNSSSFTKKKKRKMYSPSVFAILMALLLVVIIVSWIAYWAGGSDPEGQFHPAGLLEVFSAPIQGFINAADVIVFLFMLSAFLKVVNTTKALDAGIGNVFLKMQGKEIWLIAILMILFSICGTTFGMCEAAIPFYFLLIPVLIAAGFDTYIALLVVCFGAGLGVLASTLNPVLVNNAFAAANSGIQGLYPEAAELSTSNGLIWRLISYVVLTGTAVGYTIWYALRIKKNPTKSITYGQNAGASLKFDKDTIPPLTGRRKATLVVFVLTFIMLIVGAIPWDTVTGMNGFELLGQQLAASFPYIAGQSIDPATGQVVSNIANIGSWSLIQMAFLFFISAFVVGAINWKGEKNFGNQLIEGASEFMGVVFIISIATGFSVLLAETGIQNVLIDAIGGAAAALNPILFAIVLFMLFFLIAIFIPSMSGFARTVFPTVGPALSGGVAAVNGAGMTVSGSVLTFSFASGLVNLVSPTAGPFIIGLQTCEISLGKFYKSAWPLLLMLLVLCLVLLMVGTVIPTESGMAIF